MTAREMRESMIIGPGFETHSCTPLRTSSTVRARQPRRVLAFAGAAALLVLPLTNHLAPSLGDWLDNYAYSNVPLLAGMLVAAALLVAGGRTLVSNGPGAMALGLFLSAFASTEFQAVQFMPAVILPQLLLCGLLVPRDLMAPLLDWISYALPMTYAYDALARATSGETGPELALDAAVLVGSIVVALALGAATLRRRTP